jgi:hypothetical protein
LDALVVPLGFGFIVRSFHMVPERALTSPMSNMRYPEASAAADVLQMDVAAAKRNGRTSDHRCS